MAKDINIFFRMYFFKLFYYAHNKICAATYILVSGCYFSKIKVSCLFIFYFVVAKDKPYSY